MSTTEPEAVRLLREARRILSGIATSIEHLGATTPAYDDLRALAAAIATYLDRRDAVADRRTAIEAQAPAATVRLGAHGEVAVFAVSAGVRTVATGTRDYFNVRVVVTTPDTLPGADVLDVPGCHGSVANHRAEVSLADQGEELAWLVLADLLSAANDPDEYWAMATHDADDLATPGGRERIRTVLDTIEFADRHEDVLAPHAETIRTNSD